MSKEDYVKKEVAAKEEKMKLDAHNKSTLRSMLAKEYEYYEREAVREDNHTDPVEGYYEPKEY